MKFQTKVTDPVKIEADLLAVFVWEGEKGEVVFSEAAKKIDRQLDGLLTELVKDEQFEPKLKETLLIHSHGKLSAKRILLVGLGKLSLLSHAHWQLSGAVVARNAKRLHVTHLAVSIPQEVIALVKGKPAGEGMAVGLTLGSYAFEKYKSDKTGDRKQETKKEIKTILLVPSVSLDEFSLGVIDGEIFARAVVMARDLVNEPSSVTTPTHLAGIAKDLAKKYKQISCTILNKKEMQKIGMNAILGVAQGSAEEAKFIHLTYHGKSKKTICLVGKGITFDSGGLSLKPTSGMDNMKMDMAGAADILAIFSVLPILKPEISVVGLIAACENMPGSSAVKLGDVLTALNGKTIEILNSDAEGRVILADALSYVEKLPAKPEAIIDLATLTGACLVALGEEVAGILGNNQSLINAIKDSAQIAGEKVWELPLESAYQEELKSEVADLKNAGKSKYGGAITAALFLQEFVPKNIPWLHMDIAGPAWQEHDQPLRPIGGTGFGVATLLKYICYS